MVEQYEKWNQNGTSLLPEEIFSCVNILIIGGILMLCLQNAVYEDNLLYQIIKLKGIEIWCACIVFAIGLTTNIINFVISKSNMWNAKSK